VASPTKPPPPAPPKSDVPTRAPPTASNSAGSARGEPVIPGCCARADTTGAEPAPPPASDEEEHICRPLGRRQRQKRYGGQAHPLIASLLWQTSPHTKSALKPPSHRYVKKTSFCGSLHLEAVAKLSNPLARGPRLRLDEMSEDGSQLALFFRSGPIAICNLQMCVFRLEQFKAPQCSSSAQDLGQRSIQEGTLGRGILLWLLGVPIPIIILIALLYH